MNLDHPSRHEQLADLGVRQMTEGEAAQLVYRAPVRIYDTWTGDIYTGIVHGHASEHVRVTIDGSKALVLAFPTSTDDPDFDASDEELSVDDEHGRFVLLTSLSKVVSP